MAIAIEWVRYGREASQALRAAVARAKHGEPLAPVTVVVPSNHVGVAARRLLAGGSLGPICGPATSGLVAVSFVTPYRLAELLGAQTLAAAGRRPVSTPVIAAALRAALSEDAGLFAPVAGHPATEQALVRAYRELRDLSPTQLDALASSSPRAADVIRLHRAARHRLAALWYDEEDLTEAAAQAVMADQPPADLGAVVVHLPQRLARHPATLLTAVGHRHPLTVLAGLTGDHTADDDVVRAVARLDAGAAPPQPRHGPLRGLVAVERTTILTASDADDEVRAAVRAVVDAARAGTPLDRVAVLYASAEPYARLTHEHLAAAGIPTNGAAVVPVAARAAGRSLLQLLALPERGYRRQDVFAWLAGGTALQEGRRAPATAWERVSRAAAVVAGRADWDRRLAAHAERLDADAERLTSDPDAERWRITRDRAEAERARQLRRFVVDLIDELDGVAAAPRPWGEHVRWARGLIGRYLAGPTVRDVWPPSESRAAERLVVALDRLAALERVEGPVDLDVFTRTLTLELDADLGRTGRLGEGVLVGGIGLGVGLDLDLVVVLGLAEGSFPSTLHDDTLLPDHERGAAGDGLPLRRDLLAREHRQLLAALGASSRHLLGVPRGDLRRSAERVPSRWLLDVASELAGQRWWSPDLWRAEVPWLIHLPSFDGGLRALEFPATEQEHRLRDLLARPGTAEALTAEDRRREAAGHDEHPPELDGDRARGNNDVGARDDDALRAGCAGDVILIRAAEVVAARRSRRFTRFDGNLSGLAVPSPADGVSSPTALERWAGCPFAYLVHDLLRVDAVDNPEDQLRITPLDRGNLVHEALERFILAVLGRPPHRRPGPHEAWGPDDRAALAAIGADLCDDYERRGRVGRALFWRRDRARILGDLQRFLDEDDRCRAARGARPLAAELAFGLRGADLAAVPLELPDGRVVRFRGKADRVDVADDGSIHIVDYKTGSSRSYDSLSETEPDRQGRRLQLAVYGTAARVHRAEPDAPVLAEYWFTSAKGQFKRVGYWVTPDVLERVGRTLGTIVSGIESGVFPSRPSSVSTSPFKECEFCDVDGLGVADLRRAWERKRTDVALAPYAALCEPRRDADVDGGGRGDDETAGVAGA